MINHLISPFTKGIIFAVIGAVMFSSKAIFIKLSYIENVHFMALLLLRGIFSIPIFLGIAIFEGRKKDRYPLKKMDIAMMLLLGFLGYYLSSVLDFYGLQFIPASLERVILYVYPTMVICFAALFFKRRVTFFQIVSLALTYVGLVFVLGFQPINSSNLFIYKGVGFVFLSTVSYALFVLFSGEIIPRVGPVRFTALVMIFSYAFIFCHYFISFGFLFPYFSYKVIILGLCLGIICTVIPTLFLSQAIFLVGSSNTALAGAIGPISTVILAYFFLGENIDSIQFFGIALVLMGVGVLNSFGKKSVN